MQEITYLDFEQNISEYDSKIKTLQHSTDLNGVATAEEIKKLTAKLEKELKSVYGKLSPWQKVQVARHANRPHALNYINHLITDFTPLAGDRKFGDDNAIVGGLGRFRGQPVVVMGQEKGHDLQTRIKHNFGSPKPEGYRKSARLMELADRFNLPIITLVDTSGAYPGVDAEARGQSEAVARGTEACIKVKVPLVSCIIGEGGSGGAIAIAVGNRIMMLEHSVYSVISPEGCAAILWRSGDKAKDAAEALQITAQDLFELKVIDEIIGEPLGGAHRDPDRAMNAVGDAIERNLRELSAMSRHELKEQRREKVLAMGRL